MLKYEVWYAEMRYTAPNSGWLTSGGWKFVPFEAEDDDKAEIIAKALVDAPSDDPLVYQKCWVKTVRVLKEWTQPV
jgi:hypothetical protein